GPRPAAHRYPRPAPRDQRAAGEGRAARSGPGHVGVARRRADRRGEGPLDPRRPRRLTGRRLRKISWIGHHRCDRSTRFPVESPAMDAWILDESPGSYRFGTIDTPEPGYGEVRVRPVTSALNHM